jgi:hypothetical protein
VALVCSQATNAWAFETCDFSSVLVAEPSAGLIPGGGRVASDCSAEWIVNDPLNEPAFDRKGLPNRTQTCTDGDPTCDVDGAADGACTFRIGVCFNTADKRLVQRGVPCVPSDVASWELKKPKPSSSNPTDAANAVDLRDAIAALGPSTIGGNSGKNQAAIAFAPTLGGADVCTELVTIVVPLEGALGEKSFSASGTTSPPVGASRGVQDRDSLKLICLAPG